MREFSLRYWLLQKLAQRPPALPDLVLQQIPLLYEFPNPVVVFDKLLPADFLKGLLATEAVEKGDDRGSPGPDDFWVEVGEEFEGQGAGGRDDGARYAFVLGVDVAGGEDDFCVGVGGEKAFGKGGGGVVDDSLVVRWLRVSNYISVVIPLVGFMDGKIRGFGYGLAIIHT